MNDSELDQILKSARAPGRPEEYWTGFPKRVASRLHWKPRAAMVEPPRRFPRLAWGLATVAVCLVIGFAIGHWRGRTEVAANGLLQNARFLQETLAMFPNRVRAIVQDERGLSLVLSDKDDVPVSAPLWVKVSDGRQSWALVTFSGQEVELAGQKVTVLADAKGGVLLVGNDFAWSSAEPVDVNTNLKVEARNLGSFAM